GETVQVLDTARGGVHALLRLGLTQPTRFLYDFPLLADTRYPEVRRLRAEFLRDLAKAPPRCFVVTEDSWPGEGYARLERFPELRSERVDRSPSPIELARRTAHRLGVDNVRYQEGNAVDLAPGLPLDGAYVLDVVHHIPAPTVRPLLEHLYARMVPGGRLIV